MRGEISCCKKNHICHSSYIKSLNNFFCKYCMDVLFTQISCRCYLRQEGIQDTNPLEGRVLGKSCPVKTECAHVCQLLTLSWTRGYMCCPDRRGELHHWGKITSLQLITNSESFTLTHHQLKANIALRRNLSNANFYWITHDVRKECLQGKSMKLLNHQLAPCHR